MQTVQVPKTREKIKKNKNKKKPFTAAIDNLSVHEAGSSLKIPSSSDREAECCHVAGRLESWGRDRPEPRETGPGLRGQAAPVCVPVRGSVYAQEGLRAETRSAQPWVGVVGAENLSPCPPAVSRVGHGVEALVFSDARLWLVCQGCAGRGPR